MLAVKEANQAVYGDCCQGVVWDVLEGFGGDQETQRHQPSGDETSQLGFPTNLSPHLWPRMSILPFKDLVHKGVIQKRITDTGEFLPVSKDKILFNSNHRSCEHVHLAKPQAHNFAQPSPREYVWGTQTSVSCSAKCAGHWSEEETAVII